MGCTPSKETVRRRKSRESCSGLVSRSASAPIHYDAAQNKENDAGHVVSLITSSYGALKLERPGDLLTTASFARLLQRNLDGVDPLHARQPSERHGSDFKLDTVNEREESMETINIWELMEGLEGEAAAVRRTGSVEESESFSEIHGLDSSLRRKYYYSEEGREMRSCSNSGNSVEDDGHFDGSSSNRNEVDRKAGYYSSNLDALLDPTTMAKFEHALSSIASVTEDGCSRQESQAQQQHQCYSSTSASSSNQTWWASTVEGSSDAESRETEEEESTCGVERTQPSKGNAGKVDMDVLDHVVHLQKDLGQAAQGERSEDYSELEQFEWRCPPRLGEGRVVLYLTSLRGVRKTFEDCCDVRMILQGLNVLVDERDVWMHSRYRDELAELMMMTSHGHGDMMKKEEEEVETEEESQQQQGRHGYQVPQLFIKGRYIGGANQVRHLHEHGSLVRLLANVPRLGIASICSACGGFRFIPCLSCNGSCKLLPNSTTTTTTAYRFPTRCPNCNENGLIMCPICN